MTYIKTFIDKLGGRKVFCWFLCFIASTILFITVEKVEFHEWATFNEIILGALIVGNGAEHGFKSQKKS